MINDIIHTRIIYSKLKIVLIKNKKSFQICLRHRLKNELVAFPKLKSTPTIKTILHNY